jgi:hypothetical protein
VSFDFKALVAAARRDGWVTTSGDLDTFRVMARLTGWREVSLRTGDPVVSILRPLTSDEARANSLSERYGLGAQPLHTDGAHHAMPPDIVAFYSATPNATPTKLWTVAIEPDRAVPWPAVRNGTFLVAGGRGSFYTTAEHGYRRLSYDPGCMTPCDQRARIVADYFQAALEDAQSHDWTTSDQLLLVDNTRTLHARAAVSPGDDARELRRAAFHIESRS